MNNNQVKNDEIVIDLRELFGALMNRFWVLVLTAVLFGLLGIIGNKLLVTPQYQSVTKMYVLSKQSSDVLTNADLQTSSLLTKDYAELIKSRTVMEAVIADMNLDLDYDQMAAKTSVSTTSDTRIVTISVTDKDPYVARDLANAVRDTAAKHIKNVMDSEAVNVVDEANIPSRPSGMGLKKVGAMGMLLGFLLAAGIVIVLFLMNDTIKTSEDVEKYLELSVLGTIPVDSKTKKKRHSGKRR